MTITEALQAAGGARQGEWFIDDRPRSVRLCQEGIVRWMDGRRGRMLRLETECERRGLSRDGWKPERPAGA